jgi:drug/metabolite transporter (DMT)-like permease
VAALIGVFVAASFGSGDFLGGLASRQARTLSVLALAQLVALLGALLVALVGGGHFSDRALVLGATAGLLNVGALGCLYRGLAIGQIGQVAPVAAVVGAVVPIVWGLSTGEVPSTFALVGVGLAVLAGALISSERQERQGPFLGRGLPLAVAAGVGFGTSTILFSSTPHNSGFWPVLCARVAATAGVWLVVLVLRASPSLPVVPRRQAFAAGGFDVVATTLLLVALRHGLTAVVAPVASLAPGFTVMEAWRFLHERASRIQIAGLFIALVGLVLIAVG